MFGAGNLYLGPIAVKVRISLNHNRTTNDFYFLNKTLEILN